jgi:hypothetical protein
MYYGQILCQIDCSCQVLTCKRCIKYQVRCVHGGLQWTVVNVEPYHAPLEPRHHHMKLGASSECQPHAPASDHIPCRPCHEIPNPPEPHPPYTTYKLSPHNRQPYSSIQPPMNSPHPAARLSPIQPAASSILRPNVSSNPQIPIQPTAQLPHPATNHLHTAATQPRTTLPNQLPAMFPTHPPAGPLPSRQAGHHGPSLQQ